MVDHTVVNIRTRFHTVKLLLELGADRDVLERAVRNLHAYAVVYGGKNTSWIAEMLSMINFYVSVSSSSEAHKAVHEVIEKLDKQLIGEMWWCQSVFERGDVGDAVKLPWDILEKVVSLIQNRNGGNSNNSNNR
jgi:hypothetical protein